MFRSSKLACLAGIAALGICSAAAQASVVVLATPSLTGTVIASGFADGSPTTFQTTFMDLAGPVTAVALPDGGNYTVSAQGTAVFHDNPGSGSTTTITVNNPLMIFAGALSSLGITAGPYSGTFAPGVLGQNDGAGLAFGFTVNYNGQTSMQVLSGLSALLGFAFVDPKGAGTLDVTGTLYSDGAVFNFTEKNLNWVGFGNLLLAADVTYGGKNGRIDGDFELRNVNVTAVPEPAPVALIGLALAALAFSRRRRV